MDLNEYQKLALRTAPMQLIQQDEIDKAEIGTLPKCRIDLEHGLMGVVTEVGEAMDVLKLFKFYAKPIDYVNVQEEVGHILWYVAILARSAGTDLETIALANIAKLKARYPDEYTNEAALNRDLTAERAALQKHVD